MKLSIVATLYQSAPYIIEFYERTTIAAKKLVEEDYEIIFVNDGSPDNSLDLAVNFIENDPHIVVIDLSRNFGHHKAMMTGLIHASGKSIFLIDSDLEEEPEWLLSFAKQMNSEACDVVYGVQSKRKGKFFEKIFGWFFYRIFRLFTGIAQPNNITTARLMSQRYVKSLIMHKERELNIGALWIITGFKQSHQIVQKHSNSPTTYSLIHKLSHLVNSITSFSSVPLIFIFYSGLLIFISSILYISYLLIKYFFIDFPVSGFTSIIVSIWFFSGLIIFFIGIEGIYISKLFFEIKRRPYTIIRHIYKKN